MSARSSVPHAEALATKPAHVRPRDVSSDMKQHDPFEASDQAWQKCKELDHGNRMMSGKKRALAGAIREGVRKKKLASIVEVHLTNLQGVQQSLLLQESKEEEQMHAQRNGCHALQTSAVAASLLRAGWKTLRV